MMNVGTFTQQMLSCPACGKDIIGRFSYSLDIDKPTPNMTSNGGPTVPANITVTGLQVDHDCIPKVTR